MVLHPKKSRNKNQNLVAFRIPIPLSVTLKRMGVNPKELCLKALIQFAEKNQDKIENKGGIGTVGSDLMVARGRFELPSGAPEAPMLDRYTTGLL